MIYVEYCNVSRANVDHRENDLSTFSLKVSLLYRNAIWNIKKYVQNPAVRWEKASKYKIIYENHLIDDYRKSSKLREIKYKMQLTSLHKSFLLIEIVVYSSSKKHHQQCIIKWNWRFVECLLSRFFFSANEYFVDWSDHCRAHFDLKQKTR